jgi:hypothetical protein
MRTALRLPAGTAVICSQRASRARGRWRSARRPCTRYLAVTGILAVIVYEKLGLRLLRRAWINLNLFWGIALVVMGLLTLLL